MAHLLILIHGKLPAGARDLNLVFRYCTRCCLRADGKMMLKTESLYYGRCWPIEKFLPPWATKIALSNRQSAFSPKQQLEGTRNARVRLGVFCPKHFYNRKGFGF
jgi:hypothetical protein